MSVETVPLASLDEGAPYLALGNGRAVEISSEQLARLLRLLDDPAPEELLTTGEAAELLGVSARTVARLIDSGVLVATRTSVRGRRMVERQAVELYRDSMRVRRLQALQGVRQAAANGDLDDIDHESYLAQFS